MANSKMIHKFAVEWLFKFKDIKATGHDLAENAAFADACFSFEFKMDCGKAFIAEYSQDPFNDFRDLDKIIDSINDIPLLGSAIFSKWRYFNYWAYYSEEIAEPDNRAWFIIALSRLERLTADSDESPFIFQGKAKEVKIVSNILVFGSEPKADDEVEQHLSIALDGTVLFSSYNYGDGKKYLKAKTRNFKVTLNDSAYILKLIGDYFSNEFDVPNTTDAGDWKLSITNTDNVTFAFTGSLCPVIPELKNLSSVIRTTFDMPELLMFDGQAKTDRIEKIVIDYHRVKKIKAAEAFNPGIEYLTWNCSEQILVDRKAETLEYIQNIGTGCQVTRKYHVEEGIVQFLDDIDPKRFFVHIEGNPPDALTDPLDTQDYTITIDFLYGDQKVISGSFNKKGLPDDYPQFAEYIYSFMRFYGMGEILDPSAYGKVLRRPGENIYLSVSFEDGGKTYYYRTDDEHLQIGDLCIAPAGKDNHEAIVRIEEIEYFPDDNVPLPLDKTKMIIRRYSDNDLEISGEEDTTS